MFHLIYPEFRGFFTWDELGCLARGLGFPIDLFQENLADEIEQEEHGLSIKEVYKMLDNRLLERALHRTHNLHTAEWNMNALRKSVSLLNHRAITFEELYNTRVAYQAYEGFDMMGLHVDKQTLLNTLKMCGRSIAPMKLVNRVKHMTNQLEEKGRIQLYEFLDLVLWCGIYENFSPGDIECPEGKERDLFKLVDFEKLLSHHDQRLAEKLNAQYLLEEWDFGQEHLGSKKMFKDPPVKCAEDRINMARKQKRLYRHLKSEVVKSQKGVYRAKAGYIRGRPLTAPDLSMYKPKDEMPEPAKFTAQNAYEIIQRKVKSAKPDNNMKGMDTSDRPQYVQAKIVDKPRVITEEDIQDTKQKFEVLKFDMETIDGRFQIMLDDTMDTYYPGYRERHQKDDEDEIIVPKPRPKSENLLLRNQVELNLKERPKSESYLTSKHKKEQALTNLAYPKPCLSQTHAKLCDARPGDLHQQHDSDRFRGWHETKTKRGDHYILVKPSFPNTYKGRLHEKMTKTADEEVQRVKGDFLYRKTKKSQVVTKVKNRENRPSTAPATMNQNSDFEEQTVEVKEASSSDKELSPAESCKTVDTGYSSFDDRSSVLSEAQSKEDYLNFKCKSETMNDSIGENSGMEEKIVSDFSRASSQTGITDISKKTHRTKGSSKIDKASKGKKFDCNSEDELAPVPQMEHSKPRPVSVGTIGVISLLENISESRYWEEIYNAEHADETMDETGEESDETRTESSIDSGINRQDSQEIESNLALLKKRLSDERVPVRVKGKAKSAKKKINQQIGNETVSEMLDKEIRIKRQRRSQRPTSRMTQNLVSNISKPQTSSQSSSTSYKSTSRPSSYVKSAHTNSSASSSSKNASSAATQKIESPEVKKEASINFLNNKTKVDPDKTDDKTKMSRLVRRCEGALSKQMLKRLIASQA